MVAVKGAKIKALREELGLSRKECCKQAGITENTLRRLETEEDAQATPKTVRAIAGVLGIDAGLLGMVKKRSSEVVGSGAPGGSVEVGV